MRKLKLQMQLSLDGFVAGPGGELDWMTVPWSDDLNQYVEQLTSGVDTIVLGRKLAEGFIPYWKEVAANPAHEEYTSGLFFTNTQKIIFTKTLSSHSWPNTTLAHGELSDEIKILKNSQGGDIIAYGGASFVSSLIKYNLVDEYYLFFNPVSIGKGMTIFVKDVYTQFKIQEVSNFACGLQGLKMVVKK